MTGVTSYTFVERVLHHAAFATWPLQAALADIENIVYADRLKDVPAERPVFVAGLPRAGSTMLLELLEAAGEFASYSYRDMPFLLTPLMWQAVSGPFQRNIAARERAHGDGVSITADSPEAFEEVIWRTFWPGRYRNGRIAPWGRRRDEEFERFFRQQMRKVIALRREERPGAARYLSKNNGNIARIAHLLEMVPDAQVIVPFRDPLQHAVSLHRQHLRFLALHEADPFARRYMGEIGHYDFGANLRPIDFGGWLEAGHADPRELTFWLQYWRAAYAHLPEGGGRLHLISYDRLCANPSSGLATLEARLGLKSHGALTAQAERVRSVQPRPAEGLAPDELVEDANALHAALLARAAV